MSNHEINEMFSYLSKEDEIPYERLKQIFTSIYKDSKAETLTDSIANPTLSKRQFEETYNKLLTSSNLNDQLLYLFYSLDREKKGYLIPEDILQMFNCIHKKISLVEIENSFKYAKIYKNKMSFEDFKEYFHNF